MVCRVEFHLHTRQSSTHSEKYQVTHKYSYFSSWWAHSCPKYVEKSNKHTKKNRAPSWLYLQGKVVSVYALKAYSSSSTMVLDGGKWSASHYGCFTLGTEPLTEATWAPQLVCTFCSSEKISCPLSGTKPQIIQTTCSSLYWLSYPDSSEYLSIVKWTICRLDNWELMAPTQRLSLQRGSATQSASYSHSTERLCPLRESSWCMMLTPISTHLQGLEGSKVYLHTNYTS
jgi:hypothetical protein